jgi:hypothetical protein
MKTSLLAIAALGALPLPAFAQTVLPPDTELRAAALEWFEPIPDSLQPRPATC